MAIMICVGSISSGVSIYKLRSSKHQSSSSKHQSVIGWEQKYHANVTVAILTSLAFICNITYLGFYIKFVLGSSVDQDPNPNSYQDYFNVVIMTIPLNSMLNPVVYLIRKKEMRNFLKLLIQCKDLPVEPPLVALPSH